jgi:hypothetical protein
MPSEQLACATGSTVVLSLLHEVSAMPPMAAKSIPNFTILVFILVGVLEIIYIDFH